MLGDCECQRPMFEIACAKAFRFISPIILCRQKIDGTCSAVIGSSVIVNRDGWIVTAAHILQQYSKLVEDSKAFNVFNDEREEINADTTLDKRQRQRKLAALKYPAKDGTQRCSAWFGRDGVSIKEWKGLAPVDLAIAKLEPFDPDWVKEYPVFKDPSRNFDSGTSLCKLGYPFHAVTPTWDGTKFTIPADFMPLPLFPIEGILTRIANVVVSGAQNDLPAYPLQFVETSSPGLRGQSGGPTYDPKGTVWAIQSRTHSYSLGFDGAAAGQFFNVGLGVHTATLLPFFDDNGITYEVSDY